MLRRPGRRANTPGCCLCVVFKQKTAYEIRPRDWSSDVCSSDLEKADLARQFGKWDEVVSLGDRALKLSDHPNNPVERFVFIEGYAHVGGWEQAIKLSRESYQISKNYVGPLLCQLWERIKMETTGGGERDQALSKIKNMLACKP